ncbi:MAG: LolA family protein [Candidatus Brocadiia bacterium]
MTRKRAGMGICAALGAWALAGCVFALPHSARAAQPETAAPAVEAALTVDQVLDNMEAVRKKIKTFKADVAKLREAAGLDDSHFTGTIQFKSPRLLKLDLKNTENGAETISYVGQKFGWVYRPREKQAERIRLADIDKNEKAGNPLEYGLARDMHGLREGYALTLLPKEKIGDADTIPLEMTPEGGTTYTRGRVIFWIDTKSWLPVQVRQYKSNDEVVETHTFSHIALNGTIRDSTFEFDPPKDVDVLIHEEPEKARP